MELFNIEAEQLVLCQLMLKPEELERIRNVIKPDMFYDASHRFIYETMIRLHDKGVLPSFIEISHEIKQARADIVPLVAEISSRTYTAANIDYYVGVVKDFFIKRELYIAAEQAKSSVANPSISSLEAISAIESRLSAISSSSSGVVYRPVKDLIIDLAEKLDAVYAHNEPPDYIDMPYKSIARYFDFVKGEYCIIAARPSIGKTAFALSLIYKLAIVNNVHVGLFSVEMSSQQLALRLIAQHCSLSPYGILRGFYASQDQKQRIFEAMTAIGNAPITIDDTSSIPLSNMVLKARSMVKCEGCKIIFIDYIGLIDAEKPRLPRHEQIAEISRTMKALAKELHVPIVVLSQLTRDFEGKKPTLNSLAETRSLEQDADVVVFLHRDRAVDNPEETIIDTEVIVAKNRNGPVGTASLPFLTKYAKFVEKDDNEYGL